VLLGLSSASAARVRLWGPGRELKKYAQELKRAQSQRLPVKIQRSYAKQLRSAAPFQPEQTLGDGGPGTVRLSSGPDLLAVQIKNPNANISGIYRFYRYPRRRGEAATLAKQTVTYANGLRIYINFEKAKSGSYFFRHADHDRIDRVQPRFSGASNKLDKPDLLKARRFKRPRELRLDAAMLVGSAATFCGSVGAFACGGFGAGMGLLATSTNLFVGGLYVNSRH
jgi:hypothetical protein